MAVSARGIVLCALFIVVVDDDAAVMLGLFVFRVNFLCCVCVCTYDWFGTHRAGDSTSAPEISVLLIRDNMRVLRGFACNFNCISVT